MANQRIRRSSMENLQLLDLDRWARREGKDEVLPPPLPPPRPYRRSTIIEHSRTLYDMTRSQNDPIYAQTPMFTTIPRTNQEFHPRRIIGAHVPPEIIQPNSTPSTTPSTPQSANKSKDIEADDEQTEEKKDEKEKDSPRNTKKDDDDDDDDRSGGGAADRDESESSTESDDDDDDDDDILNDDDDDKRSIVEQIFNRDKPK